MHRFSPLRLPRPALAAVAAAVVAVLLSGCESMTFNLSKKIDYKSAGVDIVLVSADPNVYAPMYDAVLAKAKADPAFEQQVDDAARRVVEAKARG